MLFRVVGKFELMTSKSSLRPWFLALSSSSSLFLVKHYLLKKTVSLPELCLSQWVERLRLWELVIYISLKLQLAGGSDGGVQVVTSGTQWACGVGLTRQVTWWFDRRKQRFRKENEKKKIKKERDNTPNNRCVLGSDPARDKCCDVIWDGAGSTAWPACRWCDLIWSQEDALEGGMAGPKPPFYSRDPLSLYLSFSHMHAHKHPQSASFTAVFLALSILSVLPCCHPLSFAP